MSVVAEAAYPIASPIDTHRHPTNCTHRQPTDCVPNLMLVADAYDDVVREYSYRQRAGCTVLGPGVRASGRIYPWCNRLSTHRYTLLCAGKYAYLTSE